MTESRFTDAMRRAVVGAAAGVGVALLTAGVASAADPVQLKSRLGNWCFDAPNGSNTMVNPCDGSRSQLWVFNTAGQIESVAFPGNCVSISGAVDNTPVMLAPCRTNADNLRWTSQLGGQLTSALGPCLNVFGGVAQPGTPVIAYHCIADVDDEKWDAVT